MDINWRLQMMDMCGITGLPGNKNVAIVTLVGIIAVLPKVSIWDWNRMSCLKFILLGNE